MTNFDFGKFLRDHDYCPWYYSFKASAEALCQSHFVDEADYHLAELRGMLRVIFDCGFISQSDFVDVGLFFSDKYKAVRSILQEAC